MIRVRDLTLDVCFVGPEFHYVLQKVMEGFQVFMVEPWQAAVQLLLCPVWVARQESGSGLGGSLWGFFRMIWVGVRVMTPQGTLTGCGNFLGGKK